MQILVIGGSGFIGTFLVNELIKDRHEVTIYDKEPSVKFNSMVTIGDVRDLNLLNEVMEGKDLIYDLAAEHKDNVKPISLYYDVNVGGARNIAKAALSNGVKKIIFTSSVAVYGLKMDLPSVEDLPQPFNHYGKSKLKAEEVYKDLFISKPGNSLVIVRPTVIYGENNLGNVYNLVRQIQTKNFYMVGNGENKKSVGYVDNLVRFLIDSMQFGEGLHLFNYADKPDLTTKEMVEIIKTCLDMKDYRFKSIPYWLGLMGGYCFDLLSILTGKQQAISSVRIKKFCADTRISTKSLEETGFKPQYSIREGLERMIASMS